MKCYQRIDNDLYYVGASDKKLSLFESVFPLPFGVSYNSYLLLDEKNVLFDCVDPSVQDILFENLESLLKGKTLDYIILNHVEPDHTGSLKQVLKAYPNAVLVTNSKAVNVLKRFNIIPNDDYSKSNIMLVDESTVLSTGKHSFSFYMAPMVHWPEVMFTYDSSNQTLFSADAFGSFKTLDGILFPNEDTYASEFIAESRRYYSNIVGKYGIQVNMALNKLSKVDIKRVFPLHGPLLKGKNLNLLLSCYKKWSNYIPEDENAVLIAFTSVYGNTYKAVTVLANYLSEKGYKNISIIDASRTDHSFIVSEAFKCGKIVFASTTYNMGLFPKMEELLKDLKDHNLMNRRVGLIENGSWAPQAGKIMNEYLSSMKNITIIEPLVTVPSSVNDDTKAKIIELSERL